MSRRYMDPFTTPAPTPKADVTTAISGELRLTLPDDVIERLATAVVARLHATPASGTPGLSSPDWWWTAITQQAAADFLGTSTSSLAVLRRAKDLPTSYILGPHSPRYYRAQLVAWQLGLPIPLPPWSASTPMDWLWFPLTAVDAARFLHCRVDDLDAWQRDRGLPGPAVHGLPYFYRAQLLAWLLGEPIPRAPRWEA